MIFGSVGINNNRFAILGQINIEQEIATGSQHSNQRSNEAGVNENSGKSERKSFCPPIMLYNVNVGKLVDQLNEKKVSFKIVNKGRNKSKLFFEELPAHLEMMELLRSQGIESHSFTPPQLKRVSVVLRGLYHMTELADIKDTLEALIPETVDNVTKFRTPASIKGNYDTGLFLVTLLPGRKKDDLISIKYLFHQTITWESPKSRSREIQCYRCQKWGHTARNCNRKFSCVKCDKEHPPGECLITKDSGTVPVCVNCGNSGHTANFRGCPSFKQYVHDRKALLDSALSRKSQRTENVRAATARSAVVQGRSYASNFYVEKAPSSSGNRPAIIDKFLEIAEYFGEESLETKISKFMRNYRSVPKEDARREYRELLREVMAQYGP
ncbi:Nucleic-acid-binding protein from transposon X-element [Lucilia cuprina]|nr:Nucleic-acid-binding protein from transposon X-element [Lucilia cuprina]